MIKLKKVLTISISSTQGLYHSYSDEDSPKKILEHSLDNQTANEGLTDFMEMII